MKEINIRGNRLKIYENIDELPIDNYNMANEYSLLDYEIGGTLEDIAKKFKRLDSFLAAGKLAEAIQERNNLNNTFWYMLNHVNFPALQFGCYIHSVNDHLIKDYSQDAIKKLLIKLRVSQGEVKKTSQEVKKNSNNN